MRTGSFVKQMARVLLLAGAGLSLSAAGPVPPAGVVRTLPAGFAILASARLTAGRPNRSFWIVALRRRGEARSSFGSAPPRPLLVLEERRGRFVLVGRNDHVVFKADEGGQCDPFEDGTIAVSGRFFTVENGVACGQHWSDFITFRLTDDHGFVFDNERSESWTLNPSNDPDAESLVRDGPQHVTRDRPGRVTPFSAWRRRR